MKRFVSYLYSIYNNQKIHNAGFARIELRTGRNRIEIHLKDIGYAGKTGTVYLFVRNENNIRGVSIGNITFRGNQADLRYEQPEEKIGRTPWTIMQMNGILITIDQKVAFLSQWDEIPVDTDKFEIWEQADESQQHENDSIHTQSGPDLEKGSQGQNSPDKNTRQLTRQRRNIQHPGRQEKTRQQEGNQNNIPDKSDGQSMSPPVNTDTSPKNIQEASQEINIGKTQEINPGKTQEINPGKTQEINSEKTREINSEKTREINPGKTREMNLGKTREMNLGKTREMNLGKTREINPGKTREINPEKTQEMNLGNSSEINSGNNPEINSDNTARENGPANYSPVKNTAGMPQRYNRNQIRGRRFNGSQYMQGNQLIPNEGRQYQQNNQPDIPNSPFPEKAASDEANQPGQTNQAGQSKQTGQRKQTDQEKGTDQTKYTGQPEQPGQPGQTPSIQTAELRLQPQTGNQGWEQTWRYMLRSFPVIRQFDDEDDVLCVRIEIKDVRLLPDKYWSIINNSFLLHGFFNYRFLAFGRIGQSWFIGVPGIYQNQEHAMASIFGFPDFLAQQQKNERGEQPGYWYRILELNQP